MRKFYFFLLLAIFGLSLSINAQKSMITFQKTFIDANSNEAKFVQQTSDGGYIITGWTKNNILGFAWDIFLIKTDTNGDILWNKTYGDMDTSYEAGNCVQQTSDGGYIIAGEYSNAGFNRGFLIKTKPNGDTLWARMYVNSDSRFTTVKQTLDGGYVAGGDSKIFKLDSLGNVVWAKNYTGISSLNELQQTSDGGFIATGGRDGEMSPYLLKISSLGDIIWCKSYPVGSAKSVQQTIDGGYIVVGISGNSPPYSGYFIKTDANGDMVWGKNYGNGVGYGIFTSNVKQTNNEDYVGLLVNYFDDNIFNFNIIRIDVNGNIILAKNYQNNCYGFCVQQTSDEGFIFTGWKEDSLLSHKHEVYLIKTDQNGTSCDESLCSLSTSNITGVAISIYPTMSIINSTSSSFSVYVNSLSLTENILCETIINNNYFHQEKISIYPNPVENFISVDFEVNESDLYKFKLCDLLGQIVFDKNFEIQKGKNKLSIPIDVISSGTYLVNIYSNESFFNKIIVKK